MKGSIFILIVLWATPLKEIWAQTYYKIVESPVHFKAATATCNREARAVYSDEYNKLTEPMNKYGVSPDAAGVLSGLVASTLASQQAQSLSDRHLEECMNINGWSSDPADEFKPLSRSDSAPENIDQSFLRKLNELIDKQLWDAALRESSSWKSASPSNYLPYVFTGFVQSRLNRLGDAYANYSLAVDLGDRSPVTRLNMALVLRELKAPQAEIQTLLQQCINLSTAKHEDTKQTCLRLQN